MIDFEIIIPEESNVTPIKSTKTWYNVNDIKASEIKPFKKGYNPLNPYRLEDKVILHVRHHDRYELIEGITDTMVGSVSEILGNNMVNISYWDTRPSCVKNVPVYSIYLAPKQNTFKTKVRVFFYLMLRRVINPNKLPERIKNEIRQYWDNV
jgi:hypothetical protein